MATRTKRTFVFSGGKGASQEQIKELKQYVDDTIEGAGAVAGKPCQIQSITPITGGNRVVFLWVDNAGTSHTSQMDVMDGTDGQDGEDAPTITGVTLMSDNSLRITLSDGTYYDTTPIPTVKGDKGDKGDDGTDGFSPTITVSEDTSTTYILQITDKNGSYLTPNLKGSGGGGGDVAGVKGDVESSYRTGSVNIRLTDVVNVGANLSYDASTKTISADAQQIDVDDAISSTSENPVQNKVIKAALDDKQNIMQFDVMPTASEYPQAIVQLTGADSGTFIRGRFYRSTPKVVSGSLTYVWEQIDVQPSSRNYNDLDNRPEINGVTVAGQLASEDLGLQGQIQFSSLPSPSAAIVGKICQYTGATNVNYKNGYWYQVQYDAGTTSYNWVKIDISDNAVLQAAVTTLQTNQGDMSSLVVPSVSDLVSAINAISNKGLSSIVYTEPNLVITYLDGSTYQFNVKTSILAATEVGELANVNDQTIQNTNILQYDSAILGYKPYDIVAALTTLFNNAKDYTDQQIAISVQNDAYFCDSKPTCSLDSSTGNYVVIYYQNSVAHTTTDTTARFYYKDSNQQPFCTSWFVTGDPSVDPVEFTYSIASVNFDDYVSKTTDVTSTYTTDMADKTKIPNVAALDALMTIVNTALGAKVNTSDIEDSLNSQSATKVLSAKQGYVLKGEIDAKQNVIQYAVMPTAASTIAGVIYQYVGATSGAYTKGHFYQCVYDNDNDTWIWEEILFAPDMEGYTSGEVDTLWDEN